MKKLFAVLAGLLLSFHAAWAAVNLNTATPQQLEALQGIGPAKAKAIVDYRSKNGPFKTVDDLKKVSGIGDKTLDKLRKDLMVGGAAPAAKPVAKPAAK
ncbi:ComEA family DNA-binding protein [Chromobacterium alticapitis]|uniref:Topoisomerase n=1 Tax=Chromobacterium alticapitis TaxID=2073169 RepID=A0A2S5DHJ9_9NEIS|nr:helix-hairpin-helix domain-containing protein [Chromobacterium alticapitis]POZ62514.1 topoisomerase [Chromobacterium alticapitis]